MSEGDKDSEEGSEIVQQDDFVLEDVKVEDGQDNFLTGMSGVFENVDEDEDEDDIFGDAPTGLTEDTETGKPSGDDATSGSDRMSEGVKPEDFGRERDKTPQSSRPPITDDVVGPGRGNGTGKATEKSEIMSRLEAGMNREKENSMTTDNETNSPDNSQENQESEMDPNATPAGQVDPPEEIPETDDLGSEDVTDEEAEAQGQTPADDGDGGGETNTSQDGNGTSRKRLVMAAAVVAALLAIVGIGYLIFGDDTPDEVTADQQIASNNTDMSEEEPTGSEKDMQKADDEEEASEESDDNTSSDPPEKALADSDKGDTNEGEDADSVAHFTDNCQLKRQHGNDVGMVMSNNAQNGVVLECDDGLYTAQARVRNGNVEIKTSTLQPFDGDVEDILYVKRSQ